MKRFLLLALAALPLMAQANSDKWIRYGIESTVTFNIYASDGTFDVNEVDGGAEVTLYCDDDAGTNPITNDFADEGSYYSLVLPASETQCAHILLDIGAAQQELVHVYTFGDINAFDTTRGLASGVAQATDSDPTTIQLASATSFADDQLNSMIACVDGGTAAGDCRLITDYNGTTDEATVDTAFSSDPTDDSEYIVYQARQSLLQCSSGICDVNVLQWASTALASTNPLPNAAPGANGGLPTVDGSNLIAGIQGTITDLDGILSQQRILTGTCDNGSTTTCIDNALTQAAESQLDDRLICFDDSWCALITGFTPGTDTVTTTKIAPTTRSAKAYTIFPSTQQ